MDKYIAEFIALVDGPKLLTLAGLITLDTILGIILAIKSKTFEFSKLASFLNTSVLMMAVGYAAVGVFAVIEPAYALAVPATWLLLDASLIAMIVTKLRAMGVPIPDKPGVK
jgi:hypothetical protein